MGGATNLVAIEPECTLPLPLGIGPVAVTCCLPLPQHICVLLIFHVIRWPRVRRWRSRRRTFQENRSSRQRRPQQHPLFPPLPKQHSQGKRDPEAEAIETIQQPTPRAIPGPAAQSHQQVPGAVLSVEQVRHSPYAKNAQEQPVEFCPHSPPPI